jgi:hypothetical protein
MRNEEMASRKSFVSQQLSLVSEETMFSKPPDEEGRAYFEKAEQKRRYADEHMDQKWMPNAFNFKFQDQHREQEGRQIPKFTGFNFKNKNFQNYRDNHPRDQDESSNARFGEDQRDFRHHFDDGPGCQEHPLRKEWRLDDEHPFDQMSGSEHGSAGSQLRSQQKKHKEDQRRRNDGGSRNGRDFGRGGSPKASASDECLLMMAKTMKMIGDGNVDSKLRQMKGLKDGDTEEKVNLFFTEFEMITEEKSEVYRFKALELKIKGKAMLVYKEMKRENGCYADFKRKIIGM